MERDQLNAIVNSSCDIADDVQRFDSPPHRDILVTGTGLGHWCFRLTVKCSDCKSQSFLEFSAETRVFGFFVGKKNNSL
jgi:hypothetical protein